MGVRGWEITQRPSTHASLHWVGRASRPVGQTSLGVAPCPWNYCLRGPSIVLLVIQGHTHPQAVGSTAEPVLHQVYQRCPENQAMLGTKPRASHMQGMCCLTPKYSHGPFQKWTFAMIEFPWSTESSVANAFLSAMSSLSVTTWMLPASWCILCIIGYFRVHDIISTNFPIFL